MGRIVIRKAIEREKDKLYYIDKEGNLCEAKLQRGSKKRTKKQKEEMMF